MSAAWDEVIPADAALLRHLAQDDVGQNQKRIIQLYRNARARGASQRESQSVLEQLDFLAEILKKLPTPGSKKESRARNLRGVRLIWKRLGTE